TIFLRHSVLWPDQAVSYVCLPEDEKGKHYGAFVQETNSPICVVSLFAEPLPCAVPEFDSNSTIAVRFRKFACAPSYQGRGIGTALLKHAFISARTHLSASVVWCDARLSASRWYEKRGMRPFGESFWKGDIEYTRMWIAVW
ncbi:hypothetical protein GLOTRDRAFT_43454, partial [Gloeophyllum trabeum ATCC 11539]